MRFFGDFLYGGDMAIKEGWVVVVVGAIGLFDREEVPGQVDWWAGLLDDIWSHCRMRRFELPCLHGGLGPL